jgi:TolB-like protein/Tfp pilus assembly protein PilF
MADLWQRLKQRKLVQWALAYIAAAWALLQALGLAADSYDWPHGVMRVAFAVIALGFMVALVLAWYHGERGAQRISGTEIVILALLLAIGGALLWRYERLSPSTSSPDAAQLNPGLIATAQAVPIPAKSIAVLPFANLSGDPQQVYFSDGVTEEVLNALAQLPNLKVAARTSAFTFKSNASDVHEVGRVLGVATVLEGSIQKSGDEVRITVRLVDTRSGYQLWSENYDRKLNNIFAVEDEISNAVADKLRVQWSSAQPLVVQKTVDPRAHDFYLRGLTLLAARGPGLRNAVADFQQAVSIDPDFAQAWGAMADAEALLPSYGLADLSTAQARAMSFAQHALALDERTASAYGTLGILYLRRWHWEQANVALRHSLALAPSDAEAIDQYAQYLFACGQFTRAEAEFERAQKLDPLSAIVATMRAGTLLALRRNQEASSQLGRALAIDPNFRLAHTIATITDAQAGRFSQAMVHARSSFGPDAAELLVRGMADPGLRERVVQEIETSSSPSFVALRSNPFAFAQFLALLGARDRALDALEDLAADHAVPEPMQIWSTGLDSIRNDPRFKAVLKKMGLPYKAAENTHG